MTKRAARLALFFGIGCSAVATAVTVVLWPFRLAEVPGLLLMWGPSLTLLLTGLLEWFEVE